MGKTHRNHPLRHHDDAELRFIFSTDKCARKNALGDFKTAGGRQFQDDYVWGAQGKRDMKKSGRRAERRRNKELPDE